MSAQNNPNATFGERLFVFMQYVIPHHALSRVVHWFMRLEVVWLKNFVIRQIAARFNVDLAEAKQSDPTAYVSFNAFFTRELKEGARPIAGGAKLTSPVDAAVSQFGDISDGRVVQAKGHDYSVTELLGGAKHAQSFSSGSFITLYLSPRDYHRIHMPCAGRLTKSVYIPGRLFSVNEPTTRGVPNLFARNERVALFFDTDDGPLALVLVGALFVGSIETVWSGEITPPHGSSVVVRDFSLEPDQLQFVRGEEIARFNMGSTVILLNSSSVDRWAETIECGKSVRLGQAIV
jgi:phosphatidylserine decarboxylase